MSVVHQLRERERWMRDVLADPNMTLGTKVIAVRLALHLNIKTHQCNPSLTTLAKECSLSIRAAKSAVATLEARGFLSHQGTRGRTSNRYSLHLTGLDEAPLKGAISARSGTSKCVDGAKFGTSTVRGDELKPCTTVHPNRVVTENETDSAPRAAPAPNGWNRDDEIEIALFGPIRVQDETDFDDEAPF